MSTSDFVRHRGPVTCAVQVPNSTQLVTSSYDGAVARFDLESDSVELLGYHQHLVNRISVNDQGTLAASSSSDYTIYLWDLRTGQMLRPLLGHSDDVEDFCFIDETTGVSVSRDRRILVWDLPSGSIRRVIEGHDKDVLSVAALGGRIYTSGDDMTLRSWDLATGAPERVWGPFETETDTCSIDPVHGRVILGCDDGRIRIFDAVGGDEVATLEAHTSGIKLVAASPRNGDILSAGYDQKIHVWDAETLQLKTSLERQPTVWERSFNWGPNGERVTAGTFDGTVVVWDASTGELLGEFGKQPGQPGNDCFNDVAACRGGDVALVSDEGFLRLGTLSESSAGWKLRREPQTGRMLMNAVTFDEATDLVVAGAHDQRVHVLGWDGDELTERAAAKLDEGPINCVRLAQHGPHRSTIFAACYSGAIVRMTPDGRIDGRFRVHDNAVKALRLHPTLPIGVSGSADGVLAQWTFDGELVRLLPGHTAIIDDVDIDPSGTLVASSGRDFLLNIYSLDSGLLQHTFELGRRSPKALVFLDPDTVVVSNYWGELIRVSLSSGGIVRRTIAENGISAVTRRGDDLLASSYDGAVYLVRGSDLEVLNELRAMRQRLAPGLHA